MQVILDGMYMEGDALSMISPSDVETVEVLRGIGNTAIYGSRGGGGVLIITPKRGDSGGSNSALYTPGIVTHRPQRWESRRVGTECRSTWRSRGEANHLKKKKK